MTNSKEITNLYLYGEAKTPAELVDDVLIRPQILTSNPQINVDKKIFMSEEGAGRFAIGRQFELINDFFTVSSSILPAGAYTKTQIAAKLGLADTDYGWNMQQYDFQDELDDYAERTYIYNSMSFQIVDDAKFIVETNGARRIENFGIEPRRTVQENFDFESDSIPTSIVNLQLEPTIDPSGIGRKVNINFTGEVDRTVYNGQSYFNDLTKMTSWEGLDSIKLTQDILTLLENLWDSGVTKFLDGNKPIFYGTNDANHLTPYSYDFSAFNFLVSHISDYIENGVVLIGGAGEDTLNGATKNDKLYGGADKDTLYGSIGDDTLDGGAGSDSLVGGVGKDTFITDGVGNGRDTVDAGEGEDVIDLAGTDPVTVYMGTGNDVLVNAPIGSVIQGDAGADTFGLGKDILIADASTEDAFRYLDFTLTGGIRNKASELPWANGKYGVQYAVNVDNELVIKSPVMLDNKWTYVANYGATLDSPMPGNVLLVEMLNTAYRLLETPNGWQFESTMKNLLGYALKAMTGKSYYKGVDPLVLDLDGDGFELTAQTLSSPLFDIDKDRFAEHTGWVRGDDAFLVRDLNANGKIDDVGEMFGNATTSGFAALAALDSNNDGKISSADTAFASLRLWRDLDGDGVTDAGELTTLAANNIASINKNATSTTPQTIAGNTVTATGVFTRTNGTTGGVGNMDFMVNQRDTEWTGAKTISATAATLPEVAGYGTLTDLRIAMTLNPALCAGEHDSALRYA